MGGGDAWEGRFLGHGPLFSLGPRILYHLGREDLTLHSPGASTHCLPPLISGREGGRRPACLTSGCPGMEEDGVGPFTWDFTWVSHLSPPALLCFVSRFLGSPLHSPASLGPLHRSHWVSHSPGSLTFTLIPLPHSLSHLSLRREDSFLHCTPSSHTTSHGVHPLSCIFYISTFIPPLTFLFYLSLLPALCSLPLASLWEVHCLPLGSRSSLTCSFSFLGFLIPGVPGFLTTCLPACLTAGI